MLRELKPRPTGRQGRPWVAIMALAACMMLAAPACAGCDPASSSVLNLDHCWSVWKWLGFVVVSALAWLACATWLFNTKINPRNAIAVWPRDAFASVLGWFVFYATITFLVFFWLTGALEPPKPIVPTLAPKLVKSALKEWLMLLVLFGGVIAAWIVYNLTKHPRARASR